MNTWLDHLCSYYTAKKGGRWEEREKRQKRERERENYLSITAIMFQCKKAFIESETELGNEMQIFY